MLYDATNAPGREGSAASVTGKAAGAGAPASVPPAALASSRGTQTGEAGERANHEKGGRA